MAWHLRNIYVLLAQYIVHWSPRPIMVFSSLKEKLTALFVIEVMNYDMSNVKYVNTKFVYGQKKTLENDEAEKKWNYSLIVRKFHQPGDKTKFNYPWFKLLMFSKTGCILIFKWVTKLLQQALRHAIFCKGDDLVPFILRVYFLIHWVFIPHKVVRLGFNAQHLWYRRQI